MGSDIYDESLCRDGLLAYDAALTQLRSWVQFPFLIYFILSYPF